MFRYFLSITLSSFRVCLVKFLAIKFDLKVNEILFLESFFYILILYPFVSEDLKIIGKNIINRKDKNLKIFILIGLIAVVDYYAFYESIRNLPVLYVFLIKSIMMPVMIFIIANRFVGERLKFNNLISFSVSLIGILILFIDRQKTGTAVFDHKYYLYIGLILLAVFSYSLNINIIKKYSLYKVNLLLFIKFLPIFFISLVIFLIKGDYSFLNMKSIFCILVITLSEAISRYLIYSSYRGSDALDLEIIRYMGIISSGLFAFVMLNEIPTIYQIFGAIFIIFGNIANIYFRKKLDK